MASPAVKKAITEAALQYTKPEGKVFEYGTAGVGRIAKQTFPFKILSRLTFILSITVSHESVSFFKHGRSTPPPHPRQPRDRPFIDADLF